MTQAEGAAATFHRLVGDLEYPMFIVTARSADGEPLGRLVGFARQTTSIDPARDAFLLEPVAAAPDPGEDEFGFHRAKRIEAGHEA